MTEPVLISQYMCGKSEAGLGGTRTGFNYRDPGPLGKQGDAAAVMLSCVWTVFVVVGSLTLELMN
jgi:hypothetical protein